MHLLIKLHKLNSKSVNIVHLQKKTLNKNSNKNSNLNNKLPSHYELQTLPTQNKVEEKQRIFVQFKFYPRLRPLQIAAN